MIAGQEPRCQRDDWVLVTPMSESFEVARCDFIFFRTARSPLFAISASNSPALISARIKLTW
jgi:hypothetical protein